MGDYDSRRDYNRGGAPRFNNKRKRRDDDDADQGHRNQRHRPEAPPGTRIRRGLLEIGEDVAPNMAPRTAKSVAETIAKLVVEHWGDDYVKDTFCSVVLRLAVEQPLKIPLIAGTILFANAGKADVGALVVERLTPAVQGAINAGDWKEFKLLLRLTSCLGQLFETDGVMSVLDELFNRAVDLQTAATEDVLGVELVKIILLTIPYLIAFNDDASLKQRAAELLEKTDIVASAPHVLEPLVDPYSTEQDSQDPDKPLSCVSTISLLQSQLQEEAKSGWPLACLFNIYSPHNASGVDDANGTDNSRNPAKHASPAIEVPASVNAGVKALFPEVYFSLFADQEVETIPASTNIAASLIRDVLVDTINILDFNRLVAAKMLNELDNFWAPSLFAKRGTSLDKLKLVPQGSSTWKPEDVAVDAIFSQLLKLPSAEHKLVYYHSLITELCKISPQAIAPTLGRTIRFLYRQSHVLDLELVYRFMGWFAHHLSNFEFRWKWQEWAGDVSASPIEPKKAFILGALEKEARLSFPKRIRDTLPTDFQHLMSEATGNEEPEFKYAKDTTPYAPEGRQVLSLLKQKASEDEIQKILDDVHEQATAHGVSDPLVPSTDVYMTAICSVGSKSLSHVLSTIDRCKDRLLRIGSQSNEARRQIISSVVSFWKDHPGHAVNIVDKLLNYTIVTPMSVIEWALRDELDRGRALASSTIYEVIAVTITKVTDRLRQILQQRNDPRVPFEQRKQIDEVLPRERQSMAELFAAINDSVDAVATGAQDDMIERYEDGNEERDLLMLWGKRWLRVWRRKAAVEESVVGEAAIEPLVEPVEDNDVPDHGMDTIDEYV